MEQLAYRICNTCTMCERSTKNYELPRQNQVLLLGDCKFHTRLKKKPTRYRGLTETYNRPLRTQDSVVDPPAYISVDSS